MRDGLQAFPKVISCEDKVSLINSLSDCGFKIIEATSFAHPKHIPQFKDAADVLAKVDRAQGVRYVGLIPNMKGMERALGLHELNSGVDAIIAVVAASDSYNLENVGKSTEDSMAEMEEIVTSAVGAGILVIASIATSFGCHIEGDIPVEKVLDLVVRFRDFGADRVMFGDTTGVANPKQAREFYSKFFETVQGIIPQAHFHDTRGLALANSYAAYLEGVRHFDSSLGGLGGRPADKSARSHMGNVATEDLVSMFEEMGASTGIDLGKLIEASGKLKSIARLENLWSKLPGAGIIKH